MRLAATFGILLLANLLVQVLYVVPDMRGREAAAVRLQQELVVRAVASELDLRLRFCEDSLRRLAATEMFYRLDTAALDKSLRARAETSVIFASYYVLNTEARFVASSMPDLSRHQTGSYPYAPYFRFPFATGQTYCGEGRVYAPLGLVVSSVSVPIVDPAGKTVGVLLGSMRLNEVVSQVRNGLAGETGELALVDGLGTLLASSTYDPLAQPEGSALRDYRDRVLVSAALRGELDAPATYVQDGVEMLGHYQRLSKGGWVVLMETQAGFALKGAHTAADRLVLYNSGLFLASAILVIAMTLRVRRERERAYANLARSEEEHHATLDSMVDLIHVIDRAYCMVVVNKALIERGIRLGFDRAALDAGTRNFCPLFTAQLHAEYEQVFATGVMLVTEDERRYGGRRTVTETRKIPLLHEGQVTRIVTVIRDITDRKLAEESLQRRNAVAEALQAISAVAARSLHLDEVRETIRVQLAERLGVPAGVLFSFNGALDALSLQASWGLNADCVVWLSEITASERPELPTLVAGELVLGVGCGEIFPEGPCRDAHADLCVSLWVPLLADGRLWGVLLLCDRKALVEDEGQKPLYRVLGQSLGAAMRHAQLYQQLEAQNARVLGLAKRELEVRQAERENLARDLHDQAAQMLTSLLTRVRLLRKTEDLPRRLGPQLDMTEATVQEVMSVLHGICEDLRPVGLTDAGLVAAVGNHLASFGREYGVQVGFDAEGLGAARFAASLEYVVYRVVQEALTNVARHAQARSVDVVLGRRDGRLLAIVEDDGVGFEVGSVDGKHHLGLAGMQERAELLGGMLTIESAPGRGTTVYLEVPDGGASLDR